MGFRVLASSEVVNGRPRFPAGPPRIGAFIFWQRAFPDTRVKGRTGIAKACVKVKESLVYILGNNAQFILGALICWNGHI